MKKIKILCLLFLMLLSVSFIPMGVNKVDAQTQQNNNYDIYLFGYGEYETDANIAEFKIATTALENSASTAMESANSKMQNILNSISENNIYIENNNCIEFMRPKFKTNGISYEYTKICTFEISNTENIDVIKNIVNENDATMLCVNYKVSEIKDAYANAISNAIENAKSVANSINENYNVKNVIEQTLFFNHHYNNNSKVKISAKVLVGFNCENCEDEIDSEDIIDYNNNIDNNNIDFNNIDYNNNNEYTDIIDYNNNNIDYNDVNIDYNNIDSDYNKNIEE